MSLTYIRRGDDDTHIPGIYHIGGTFKDWTRCTVEDAKRMRDELDGLSEEQQGEIDGALQKYGWPVMWCSRHVVFWLHGEAVRRGWLKG